jgi:hypothetical protein
MAEIPNDIPGNSKKQQNAAQGAPANSAKPPVPVFEGPSAGVKRKNAHPIWHWFKRMFLSDRKPKDILLEVVEQRIVPGIKDNMRNSAMATIDSFIYPGTGAAPVSMQNNVSYNRIYSGQPQNVSRPAQPQTQTKQDEINNGFSNPCFKHQFATTLPDGKVEPGATDFLALMKNYDFPTLSVHTMYLMQKKHIDYTWDAYGWTREEIQALGPGCIRRTGNAEWPWMIVLPEAHVIS